jgi:hypothetical protein
MSRHSRLAPILLVFALLAASPALPQARRGAASPYPASLTEAIRGFLPDFLIRLWENLGCDIDPYGSSCRAGGAARGARPAPTAVWAAEGCLVDPNGRCVPRTTTQQTNGH